LKVNVPLRDGQELQVRVIGRGQPVVLLHGFGSEALHWVPNILPLSHKFQFILPDLRGFGLSHHLSFSNPNVFAEYAHDLEDVLNHFNLHQVILGGISTGAYTCLVYNSLYGFERVERYLNIEHAPCSRNSPGQFDGIFRELQDEIFAGFAAVLERVYACPQPVHYWELPNDIRKTLRDTMSDLFVRAMNHPVGKGTSYSLRFAERAIAGRLFPISNMEGYFHIMQAFMNGQDTTSSLHTIQAPIKVMAGQHSEFFTLSAQQSILEHAPNASMTVFKRSGHIPILDRPLTFQREFMRFFTQPTSGFIPREIKLV
jgi:pimeloyl-ACP methyl ester carboxylesterase